MKILIKEATRCIIDLNIKFLTLTRAHTYKIPVNVPETNASYASSVTFSIIIPAFI